MSGRPSATGGTDLAHDPETLAALLQSNYRQVLGFFLKLTQDPNLAQDLTQETMVKAIVHINQYRRRPPSPPG